MRDHLAGDSADADVAGSAHVCEHALSRREVPQRLPVPRSAACVEEPVLARYRPAVGLTGSAEHHVEVPAVPRPTLATRWSDGLVFGLLRIEQPRTGEVVSAVVAEVAEDGVDGNAVGLCGELDDAIRRRVELGRDDRELLLGIDDIR